MTDRNGTPVQLPALRPGAASRSHRAEDAAPDPRLAAQLAGATGARGGLRGGTPVLDAAQAAYLRAQWSGPADRRVAAGVTRAARA